MNKNLSLLLALSFCLLISAQDDTKPAPPTGGAETNVQAQSAISKPPSNAWNCNIDFYWDGTKVYSESLSQNDKTDYRGTLSSRYDNKIDQFKWKGTRCYCWVVVYQDKNFKGLNAGFWTWTPKSGSYDLSNYNTYDFADKAWERWDKTVSSYAIYCY